MLISSYTDLLPTSDLTQLVFWDRTVMNEIESETLRNHLRDTSSYYKMIFD